MTSPLDAVHGGCSMYLIDMYVYPVDSFCLLQLESLKFLCTTSLLASPHSLLLLSIANKGE